MTVTIITADVAEELLNRAVKERGTGYRYPGTNSALLSGPTCHYRWDTEDLSEGRCTEEQVGQPACVVGQVFDYAGLLSDLAPELHYDAFADPDGTWSEDDRFFGRNDVGVDEIMDSYDLPVTPLAAAMLREAQGSQDTGSAWGVAARRGINIRYTSDLPDVITHG